MTQTLYTIGYEGVSVDDFVATLKQQNIQLVIDVRDYPGSRRKGFSKNILAAILDEANIEYVHLKNLGDPKEGRDAARAGNFDRFIKIFSNHMKTPEALSALEFATQLSVEKKSCLMCYERSHLHCHRSIVAKMIVDETEQDLTHLGVHAHTSQRLKKVEPVLEYA